MEENPNTVTIVSINITGIGRRKLFNKVNFSSSTSTSQ